MPELFPVAHLTLFFADFEEYGTGNIALLIRKGETIGYEYWHALWTDRHEYTFMSFYPPPL